MKPDVKDLPGAVFAGPYHGLKIWRCKTCGTEFAINGTPRFCPMCDAMLGLEPDAPEAFDLGKPHTAPKVKEVAE